MDTEKMFELADRLRALRDEKAEVEQYLKEIKAEMDEVDYRLSELMAESETQNFTRSGTMFCLTTKTHASAVAGRKEELFSALAPGASATLCMKPSTPTASPPLSRNRWRKTAICCRIGWMALSMCLRKPPWACARPQSKNIRRIYP